MQQKGRVLRAGRLLTPVLALLLAATVVGASGTSQSVNLPSGSAYGVEALITPGPGGGGIEFIGGWEEEMEFSVRVDGEGNVTVNGDYIGDADPNGAVEFRIAVANGQADVTVLDGGTGDVLCTELGVSISGDVDTARASGVNVHSLDAN